MSLLKKLVVGRFLGVERHELKMVVVGKALPGLLPFYHMGRVSHLPIGFLVKCEEQVVLPFGEFDVML